MCIIGDSRSYSYVWIRSNFGSSAIRRFAPSHTCDSSSLSVPMAVYPCYKYYGKEIVDSVAAILKQDTDVVPAISKTKKIRKILMDNKISYRSKKLHSKYLLVHRRNRGGVLVNAFNSHRNGAKIASVGGDRAELHSAVCIELNPDPENARIVVFCFCI